MLYLRRLAPLAVLAALIACAACDVLDDIRKSVNGDSKTGVDMKLGGDSAKIGVSTDDGNPFYTVECSAGISLQRGIDAGCQRKWKPLFYGLVAGGGVVAILLLSCCFCCCCAPCRRKNAAPAYFPVSRPMSTVILVNAEAPNPVTNSVAVSTAKYDVPMIQP